MFSDDHGKPNATNRALNRRNILLGAPRQKPQSFNLDQIMEQL
jgi:hypothetical protein